MQEVTWGSSALCKTWPAWKGCRRDAPSGRSRRLPPGRACNKSGALVSSAGVALWVSFVLVAAREHLHRPGPDPVPRAQGCACTPCPLRGGLAASALRGGREGGREGSSSAPPAWPAPSPFLQGAAGSAVAVLTSSPEGWSVLPAAGGAALRESAPAWPPAPPGVPGAPAGSAWGCPRAAPLPAPVGTRSRTCWPGASAPRALPLPPQPPTEQVPPAPWNQPRPLPAATGSPPAPSAPRPAPPLRRASRGAAQTSRTEPRGAERSRAQPSGIESSGAEPIRAQPSPAVSSEAEPSRARASLAEPSPAEPSRAERSGQARAGRAGSAACGRGAAPPAAGDGGQEPAPRHRAPGAAAPRPAPLRRGSAETSCPRQG